MFGLIHYEYVDEADKELFFKEKLMEIWRINTNNEESDLVCKTWETVK